MTSIKQLMTEMAVSNYVTPGDDHYDGTMIIRHTETGTVAVWPYRFQGNTMAPHSKMHVVEPETGARYDAQTLLQSRTVADIQATDLATNKYLVPFGPVGMKRALARWMKEAGF